MMRSFVYDKRKIIKKNILTYFFALAFCEGWVKKGGKYQKIKIKKFKNYASMDLKQVLLGHKGNR